jgi:hypothetical protein
VADCFKYRHKIGIDVAIEALRDALRSRKTTVDEIHRFAKACRVANVMRPYLESAVWRSRRSGTWPDRTARSFSTWRANRGEDFQFLLGRWVVERFLYRLAGSSHKNSFVLKGAMLFLAWEGRLHRPTKDLDLLGSGSPDVLDVTRRIRDVCAVPADDGIVFDLAGIAGERINEDAEYEGVRVRVPASLDGACVSMQIDVGFGDLVDPPPRISLFPCCWLWLLQCSGRTRRKR